MGEDLNQEGESMISQGILPFKIERTEELITPRSGLALFAEVIRALGVKQKVEGHFPKPDSNRGYKAWSYIEPVLLSDGEDSGLDGNAGLHPGCGRNGD